MSDSVGFILNPNTPGLCYFGPFPRGTIIRSLTVVGRTGASFSGVHYLMLASVFRSRPLASAFVSDGIPLIGMAENSIPSVGDEFQGVYLPLNLLSKIPLSYAMQDDGWIGVSVRQDSTEMNGFVGLEVEYPEGDQRRGGCGCGD